jgi:hypothetical protein
MRRETIYGFFHGGDPREFVPDTESCSEKEISAHRKACELFNAAEAAGLALPGLDCESGWETLPDGTARHVLKSSFGIGTYQMDVPETEEEWNAALSDEED